MKQIFGTVNFKFKFKISLCLWGLAPILTLYTYMNKIFKIVIQFKKSVQNIQRNSVQKRKDFTNFSLSGTLFITLTRPIIFFKLNLFKNCITQRNIPSTTDMGSVGLAWSDTPSLPESGPSLVTTVATVPPLQSTGNQETRFSPSARGNGSGRQSLHRTEIQDLSPIPEYPEENWYITKSWTNGTQN